MTELEKKIKTIEGEIRLWECQIDRGKKNLSTLKKLKQPTIAELISNIESMILVDVKTKNVGTVSGIVDFSSSSMVETSKENEALVTISSGLYLTSKHYDIIKEYVESKYKVEHVKFTNYKSWE